MKRGDLRRKFPLSFKFFILTRTKTLFVRIKEILKLRFVLFKKKLINVFKVKREIE